MLRSIPALSIAVAATMTQAQVTYDVPQVQTRLAEIGCYDGDISGQTSLELRTAIRCLQRSLGEATTGELTDTQLSRLTSADAAPVEMIEPDPYAPTVPDPDDFNPLVRNPDDVAAADAERAQRDLDEQLAARAAEQTAQWQATRDSGSGHYTFGDGVCDLGRGFGQHSMVCRRYLADTAPPDSTVACAGARPDDPHDDPPMRCVTLPDSFCAGAGGEVQPYTLYCMLPEDLNNPALGSIGFNPEASQYLQWRLVAGALALKGPIPDAPSIHLPRGIWLEEVRDAVYRVNVDTVAPEDGIVTGENVIEMRRYFACSAVFESDQYDGIRRNQVVGGDPEAVKRYCADAARCATYNHLSGGHTAQRDLAIDLLETRLCTDRDTEQPYLSIARQPIDRATFVERFRHLQAIEAFERDGPTNPQVMGAAARVLQEIGQTSIHDAFLQTPEGNDIFIIEVGMTLNALRVRLGLQALNSTQQ